MLAGEFGRFDVFAGPDQGQQRQGDRRRPARSSSSPTSTSSRRAPPAPSARSHVLVGRRHQRAAPPTSPPSRTRGPATVARRGPITRSSSGSHRAVDLAQRPRSRVESRGIVKALPRHRRQRPGRLRPARGEVHALLGENGAGKSTLMNILAGLYRPDAGDDPVDGRPVGFRSPRDAIAAGIGMVHQHFTLVPSLTVDREHAARRSSEPRFRLDLARRSSSEVASLAARSACASTPTRTVWQLSVGEQQRVEILKILYRGARDPDPGRADRRARAAGGRRAVPHAALDGRRRPASCSSATSSARCWPSPTGSRCMRARQGHRPAASPRPADATRELARLMVGRDVLEIARRGRRADARRGDARGCDGRPARATTAACRPCTASRSRSAPARSSGIAGVAGNGQRELAEVITGLRPCRGTRDASRRGGRQPDGRRTPSRPASATSRGPDAASAARQPVDRRTT